MKKILLAVAILFSVTIFAQEKPEGLYIKSKAPEFKVKDQNGTDISLKDIRKKGPVVLVFYRGNWCPYCNKALSRLEDSLQLIKDKGATLIAITPEKQEGIEKTVEKTKAEYPIIYDEDLKIMKAYDVAFKVDEKTITRYKMGGIDLMENNNQQAQSVFLPVPAVYIIDKEGNISFRYFDENYKKRVSVKEILKNL